MKHPILIFFLLAVGLCQAQSIKLRGTIQDSIGNPLELANVIAKVQQTGAIESYAITNSEGRFMLDLPVNNTYELTASFLGYETITSTIQLGADAQDREETFVLKESAAMLDGVELVYEMPVTVKGDTIVYNADSFNRGDERKLGDVMKNLPGIEVNEEGEIEVEGKPVQKVMVEGKDFFDGDSKLATKNIPADAVDKVEVLRNYNEVDQMRGLGNDQDNVAINIKLKEGKKNFWFGEITAGSGVDDEPDGRYLVHPKLFYYSPDYSLNIITDFNDIGEVPFTFRDYFNFTGGFRNFNRGGGTNFNISESDLGFATAQNNRAAAIESNFLAANFSWAASKKWDLSGFGILSDNKTNMVTNTLRQYISTGTVEATNSDNNQRSQLGMLKLSSIFKPNSNFQLDYDALVKGSKQTEEARTLSQFEDLSNDIAEDKENTPVSVNQNINAYYTLDDDNIFAGQIQHLWQDEDPFYNAITDLAPFSGILPVDTGVDRYDVNQQKKVLTNKLDAKIDYYYVINNKSNINISGGATFSRQQFDSNIFQILEDGSRLDFLNTPPIGGQTEPLVNDVEYGFTDLFLGARYKLKAGKFTITPGATLHNYNIRNEQFGLDTSQNQWMVLPEFNTIFEIKKSENIRFNYAMQAQYTDVNNFAEAYVFNNYNRMFRGNRFLENAISNNLNLSYFNFNMFSNISINANINYSRQVESIKTQTAIVRINQVASPVNIDSNFPDENLSVFGRLSKRVKKITFNADARVSWNKSNNIIVTPMFDDQGNMTGQTEDIQATEGFLQNYSASFRSTFRDWPNFEAGYGITINDYNNGGLQQTFYTHRPFVNVDVNFLKHFTFSADWEFSDYSNKENTVQNDYSFLNATLYFQNGDSPWEFSLQGTNLLNTEFLNTDNINDQFTTTSQYFVLPRIVMLVATYNL